MRTKLFPPYQVIFLLLVLGASCKKDDDKGPDTILNISRTNIELGNDVGYTDTVVVQSNSYWTISVSDGANAWLSVEPVKRAAGDSTIVTIKTTEVNTSASQTATLTITPTGSNAQSRQINITRNAYSLVWQKCYGGTGDDKCYSTALLSYGQFVTTGSSNSVDGDALGNNSNITGWVLRAGSDANKIWQKQMGGLRTAYQSIVASPDGGTVSVGYTFTANRGTDLTVVKFDGNGNVVWNKTYGGSSSDFAYRIINTADGGFLVTGDTFSKDGDVKSNKGGFDSWVIKLDANGNLVWEKTFGGAKDDIYTAVTACPDGGYILLLSTNSNNSGDVPINHGGNDSYDILGIKIDANGNKVWSKTFGGSSDEEISSAISDTDGGCILVGYTTSTDGDVVGRSGTKSDMWVLKLTKDGQIGWQAALGGSGVDVGNSIARLPNGNVIIGGNSDSGITGNHGLTDVWVTAINNTGKILWQKTFGSSGIDENTCINAMADGSILVTNIVSGYDGDVTGNHGNKDTWIFKLQ
jgi:hypothetical protein